MYACILRIYTSEFQTFSNVMNNGNNEVRGSDVLVHLFLNILPSMVCLHLLVVFILYTQTHSVCTHILIINVLPFTIIQTS